MKKLFVFALFLFSAHFSYSQFDLGVKVMPNLSANRVEDLKSDETALDNKGIGARIGLGVVADIYFAKNYAFSTGLNYLVKRAAFSSETAVDGLGTFKSEVTHNLQYVQIPVGLKLFTNEIATDIKGYVNIAGTADIKVAEKMINYSSNFPEDGYKEAYQNSAHYTSLDFGGFIALGAEMALGENTKVFGGLFYNRGFMNVVKDKLKHEKESTMDVSNRRDEVRIGLSMFGLEAGIKF